MRTALFSMIIIALCASVGFAGTEGYRYVRSEQPQQLDIDVENVLYDFSGNATVNFTLRGSRASVWLAIYTNDQSTPGGWGGPGDANWNNGHALNRAAGIPNMVNVIELGAFEEGPGSGTWNGTDWEGNAVDPGTYTLYVIGLNNLDDSNWVGMTGWGFRMRSTRVSVMQGQGYFSGVGALLGTQEGGPREGKNANSGQSFMFYPIAPGNFLEEEVFDLIRIVENVSYDVAEGDKWPLNGQSHGAAVDPNDFTRWWMYGYGGAGIIGVTIDEDFTTAVPMEGFGDPPHSWKPKVVVDDNANNFNSLEWYEGKLYMGHGYGTNPPVSDIYELDPATGEVTNVIDASEAYVWEAYGADGQRPLQASMIGCIVLDEQGLAFTAGGWGGASSTRSPTKIDWNGDIVFMNDAGDGFNDWVYGAEAEALGIEERRSGQAHVISGARANGVNNDMFYFVTEGHAGEIQAQPAYGAIYGPDGAGIFHVTSAKMALSGNDATGSGTNMIHQQSDWDGLYIVTAEGEGGMSGPGFGSNSSGFGYQTAHMPFHIESALIGTDVTAVLETSAARPDAFKLGDAYPNPFNAQTAIEFAIPVEGHALLTVFNSQGQKVSTLVNEFLSAGSYRTTWNGNDVGGKAVAGGLYFYRLKVGDHEQTKKMTLLK